MWNYWCHLSTLNATAAFIIMEARNTPPSRFQLYLCVPRSFRQWICRCKNPNTDIVLVSPRRSVYVARNVVTAKAQPHFCAKIVPSLSINQCTLEVEGARYIMLIRLNGGDSFRHRRRTTR